MRYVRCGKMFQRTSNVSVSTFNSKKKETLLTRNSIDCAHQCMKYVSSGEVCNAFSYDESSLSCELASLSFLEDPLEDGSDGGEKKIMLHSPDVEELPRVCRGGEHCCRPDSPCSEGQGDCNSDRDCAGAAVCGQDNCAKDQIIFN